MFRWRRSASAGACRVDFGVAPRATGRGERRGTARILQLALVVAVAVTRAAAASGVIRGETSASNNGAPARLPGATMGASSQSAMQEPPATPSPAASAKSDAESNPDPLRSPSREPLPGFHPWNDAARAGRFFLDKQNQFLGAFTTLGTVVGHQTDPELREYFARRQRLGEWDHLGNDALGTGVPGLLLAGGFWAFGAREGRAYEIRAGQAQLETIAVTAFVTFALKVAVRRDRPGGADQSSFPSGHTSTVAASAMTLQEFYGWRAGVPMFALTALTAASRLSVDAHWFSDTVAGAGIGFLMAHAFARAHLDSPNAAARVGPLWLPVVTSERTEIRMAWGF